MYYNLNSSLQICDVAEMVNIEKIHNDDAKLIR